MNTDLKQSFDMFKVELLWRRAVADKSGGIYCLAYTGLLSYDVSEKAVLTLEDHTSGKTGMWSSILILLNCWSNSAHCFGSLGCTLSVLSDVPAT